MKGGIKLPEMVPMSQEQQAYELIQTVKCKLGVSKVHGIGVIAIRDIKKEDLAYCGITVKPNWYTISFINLNKYIGVIPEIRDLILERWPQIVNGAPFISPNYDARLTSFMNHSDVPNYDPETDKILEDIKAGGEVFCNYRVIPQYELVYPWLKSYTQEKKPSE